MDASVLDLQREPIRRVARVTKRFGAERVGRDEGRVRRQNEWNTSVGETGGKDFILAHPSADPKAVGSANGPR